MKNAKKRRAGLRELTDTELDQVTGGAVRRAGQSDNKFIYHGSDTTGRPDKIKH